MVDNDALWKTWAGRRWPRHRAGADIVAPSGMMDGMIGFLARKPWTRPEQQRRHPTVLRGQIRVGLLRTLPRGGCFGAVVGDRRGYQMDVANIREAIREVALDVEEGADISWSSRASLP